MSMFTVKQLSRMAGITPRTLHYYDEIGLLKPSEVGENGYRYYGKVLLSGSDDSAKLYRRKTDTHSFQ